MFLVATNQDLSTCQYFRSLMKVRCSLASLIANLKTFLKIVVIQMKEVDKTSVVEL